MATPTMHCQIQPSGEKIEGPGCVVHDDNQDHHRMGQKVANESLEILWMTPCKNMEEHLGYV